MSSDPTDLHHVLSLRPAFTEGTNGAITSWPEHQGHELNVSVLRDWEVNLLGSTSQKSKNIHKEGCSGLSESA